MLRIDEPCLLISDLHVKGDQSDQPLLDFLASDIIHEKQIRHILFVGDIFDFNLGYQSTLYRRHLPFYLVIHQLKLQGIHMYYFTGNHDPDPCPILCKDLNLQYIEAPANISIFGHTVLVQHGDLLDPNHIKRWVCRFARFRWLHRCIKILPPIVSLMFSKCLTHSNHTPFNYSPLTEKLYQKVRSLALKSACDTVIIGHYHRVVRTPISDQPRIELFILGDWLNLHTGLIWNKDGANLYSWRRESMGGVLRNLNTLGEGDITERLLIKQDINSIGSV